MNPSWVVDTNVIVSGLITRNHEAAVCRILDGMLDGAFAFVLSPELLAEYRQVLMRPAVARYHGRTTGEIDLLLQHLVANGIWREPPSGPKAPDAGDDHLWAILASVPGTILITGDRLLSAKPPSFTQVLSPAEFLQRNPISR